MIISILYCKYTICKTCQINLNCGKVNLEAVLATPMRSVEFHLCHVTRDTHGIRVVLATNHFTLMFSGDLYIVAVAKADSIIDR